VTRPEAGTYRLKAQLPSACTGGILRANAPGYLEGLAVYDGSAYAEVMMKPLKKFKVSFVKHRTNDFSKTSAVDEAREVVSVHIKGPDNYEEFLLYPSEEEVELELIFENAEYDLEIYLLEDSERITGGYAGKWSPTYAEMFGTDELTFHIAQIMPIPVSLIEQGEAVTYIDTGDYKEALKPTFG
jgi:hypothetical protein